MNYLKITSWTLAVLFALSSIPTDAEAIASKRKKDTKEQVQEEKFPGATREEPPQKYTNASSSNRIKKLGDLYNTEGKEQQTIEAAKEIWTNPKSNAFERALAYQLAGNAAYNLDDITLAIDYLKKAVEEDALSNNSHFQSMQQIASFYINDGLYEESIPWIERLISEANFNDPKFRGTYGSVLYSVERYADAIEPLSYAITHSEDAPDAWMQMLTNCYVETDRMDEAVALADKTYQTNPGDKVAIRNAANIYRMADRVEKAAEIMDEARSKGLLSDESDYKTLMYIYSQMDGREQQTIDLIEEGVAKGILKADLSNLKILAQTYYYSDNGAKAVETYQKAEAIDSTGESALNLAIILNQEERFAEAIAAAQRAIAKGQVRTGEAWMVIASAQYAQGNNPAMVTAYEQAAKYPETKQRATEWLRRNKR